VVCTSSQIWHPASYIIYYNRQVYKYKHMITSRGNVLYPAPLVTQSQLYRKGCNKPHPVVVTAQIGCGTLYLAVEKPTQLMPLISVAAGGQYVLWNLYGIPQVCQPSKCSCHCCRNMLKSCCRESM